VVGIKVVVVFEAAPKAFCFLSLSVKAFWGGTQDFRKCHRRLLVEADVPA
jgi:hypothetical protein